MCHRLIALDTEVALVVASDAEAALAVASDEDAALAVVSDTGCTLWFVVRYWSLDESCEPTNAILVTGCIL